MDRATKKLLQLKVDYLARITGKEFYLQSAYNNGYRLYEVDYDENERRTEHDVTTYRLLANEMRWYLSGMIDAIEQRMKSGSSSD